MKWKEPLIFSFIGLLIVAALLRKDQDVEKLVGTWEIVEVEEDGLPWTAKQLGEFWEKVIITRSRIRVVNEAEERTEEAIFSIRPGFGPAQIDLRGQRVNPGAASGVLESLLQMVTSFGQRVGQGTRDEETLRGIYRVDRDCLKLCLTGKETATRPSEFRTTTDSQTMLFVLKRSSR